MEHRPDGWTLHQPASKDPLSVESLVQRHENRQFLLQRLSALRQQIRLIEQEVSDIENVVHGLPYTPACSARVDAQTTALRHFHVAATAGQV